MEIKLQRGFADRLKGRFGKYDFQVGILVDGPHKVPKRGKWGLKGQDVISTYAGGPIRQKTRKDSDLTISEVSVKQREHLGFNYLTEPFKKRTSEIIKFSNSFFRLAFGASEKKRAENLLQAVVRNPIIRGDYGPNAPLTRKVKGFDRKMIDTGQLFKAIKAMCRILRKR